MPLNITKKHLLVLEIVLVLTVVFQGIVFIEKTNLTGKVGSQLGDISFCFESEPYIEPIPNFSLKCGDNLVYEVNVTSYCHEDYNMVFSDDTHLFDINPNSGLINFTPNGSHVGSYDVYIYVFENEWISKRMFHIDIADNLEIKLIPDMVINVSEPFYYQVEMVAPGCMSGVFSDNTNLFDINPVTGVINFTPTLDDIGTHLIYIYAINGPYLDVEQFYLTIKQVQIDAPKNFSVRLLPDYNNTILNWSYVNGAGYYEVYYTDNISDINNMQLLANTTNNFYYDYTADNVKERYYRVAAVSVSGNVKNFTSNIGCKYAQYLVKGWNLFGTTCMPDDYNITEILKPLTDGSGWGYYDSSWGNVCDGQGTSYNGSMQYLWHRLPGGSWQLFDPNELCFLIDNQEFKELNAVEGFWVKMNRNHELSMAGMLVQELNYSFKKGWNLISPIITTDKKITTVFDELSDGSGWGYYDSSWGDVCNGQSISYNGSMQYMWRRLPDGSWQLFDPNELCFLMDNQPFNSILPEEGYWFKMKKDKTMIMIYNRTI